MQVLNINNLKLIGKTHKSPSVIFYPIYPLFFFLTFCFRLPICTPDARVLICATQNILQLLVGGRG